MQSEGATAFAVARTTGFGPLLITIVCPCGWTIVSEGNDSCVFGQDCSYFNLYTMRFVRQVFGETHINFIEAWAMHNFDLQRYKKAERNDLADEQHRLVSLRTRVG